MSRNRIIKRARDWIDTPSAVYTVEDEVAMKAFEDGSPLDDVLEFSGYEPVENPQIVHDLKNSPAFMFEKLDFRDHTGFNTETNDFDDGKERI